MRRRSVALAVVLMPMSVVALASTPARVESIRIPGARITFLDPHVTSHSVFAPAWLQAAPSPSGDDNGVDLGVTASSESFSQLQQSAAVLPGGGFATTWREGPSETATVRLQFVRANGDVVFPDGGLALTTGDGGIDTVVTPHASSGAFVAYQRAINSGSNGIQVQWIDGDGVRRWTIEGVPAFGPPQPSRHYRSPQVLAHPDGGAFVCATENRFAFDTPVRCQRISADGVPMWTAGGLVVGGIPGWRVLPKLVADDNGGVLVFWVNKRVHNDTTEDPVLVEGQHFDASGTRLWGANALLVRTKNLPEVGYHTYSEFAAVADGAGGAVVAFDDYHGEPPRALDVYAQRITADGSLPWGTGLPVAIGPVQQQLDSLTAVRDGGAILASVEFDDDDRSAVRLYRIGADGAPRWGATGVWLADPMAAASIYGSSGQVDGNRLRMAWTNQKQPGTYTFDIFAADFTLDGARLGPFEGNALFHGPDTDWSREFVHDAAHGVSFAAFDVYRQDTGDFDTMGALYPPDAIFRDGLE